MIVAKSKGRYTLYMDRARQMGVVLNQFADGTYLAVTRAACSHSCGTFPFPDRRSAIAFVGGFLSLPNHS